MPPTTVQVPVAAVRLDGPGHQPGTRAVAVEFAANIVYGTVPCAPGLPLGGAR